MFDRGYTGHEHLYAFGFINMNGRCYDPVMSSFLSVDAYVQSPDNSQNFNRYSYCLNNPLKYTDPSGWRVLGASMGSHTTGAVEWGTNYAPAYEPRDLGLPQLTENAEPTGYRRGNKLEGGSGGCSNSGEAPIIDPSEMPKDQQEAFNSAMEFASENSLLFKNLYIALCKSKNVYKITIGKTIDGHPALFNKNTLTLVFGDEYDLCAVNVYSEELFHVFQLVENASEYNSLEHNYEFEAKVFSLFVVYQIQTNSSMPSPSESFVEPNFKKMMEFIQSVTGSDGLDNTCPSFSTIHSNSFLKGYQEGADYYYQWNKANNYGDSNYRKQTLQKPHSLLKLSNPY